MAVNVNYKHNAKVEKKTFSKFQKRKFSMRDLAFFSSHQFKKMWLKILTQRASQFCFQIHINEVRLVLRLYVSQNKTLTHKST